eukprot:TRINITY_DN60758_c0_g1_i1.p1 TRINITY_DN60758_c0_g1~~TRINITY_DN60758_c0_g1_i1.p1  ORF type:complete len:463 (+),score=75.98 TRINITY_DN60758_c0_g1_i1:85-1473(+)
MATTSVIKVCQNVACKASGSFNVLRDIEELAGDICDVEACLCLGKCGKGPNVEICDINGLPNIYMGINSWTDIVEVVEDMANVMPRSFVKTVGKYKYDARRAGKRADKLSKIEAGFKAIGGEELGIEREPRLAAELFILRSQTLLKTEAPLAVKYAHKAMDILPQWPRTLLALADAEEKIGRPDAALKLVTAALEKGVSSAEKSAVKDRITKLQQTLSHTTVDVIPVAKAIPTTDVFKAIGGHARIAELAHKVHEVLFEHNLTKHYFPPTASNERITRGNVNFLCGAFGGPKYTGPDLIFAHEFLRITDKHYDVMVKAYEEVLKTMRVSLPIQAAIMKQIEGTRPSIVFRPDRPNPSAQFNPKILALHNARVKSKAAKSGSGVPARKTIVQQRQLACPASKCDISANGIAAEQLPVDAVVLHCDTNVYIDDVLPSCVLNDRPPELPSSTQPIDFLRSKFYFQ